MTLLNPSGIGAQFGRFWCTGAAVYSNGEALAPTIQKVADFIQGLVDKFNALTPAQQETIVQIGLVVAAIGPLLIIIGKVISSVGTIMTWAPKIVSGVQNIIGIGSKRSVIEAAGRISFTGRSSAELVAHR